MATPRPPSSQDGEQRTWNVWIPCIAAVDQPGGGAWAELPSPRAATRQRMREGAGPPHGGQLAELPERDSVVVATPSGKCMFRLRARQTLTNGRLLSSAPFASAAAVSREQSLGEALKSQVETATWLSRQKHLQPS